MHNRLWNGGNGEGIIKLYRRNGSEKELIDEIYAKNMGCEWGEYDI
jgi:ribosomal protein S18 acetylase RimI-like enzyme